MNLVGVIFGFALATWLTWRFCDPASRFYIPDHPNERSLHAYPLPRSGGLAILAGVVLGMALVVWRANRMTSVFWLSLSLLLVALVSYIDDRRHVPVIGRLIVHLIAASLLLWGGFFLRVFNIAGLEFTMTTFLGGVFSMVFIVWMINLYNFMDGMDGFAGGMAVIGFGTFALLGWEAEDVLFTWLNLVTAAAAGGFLLFNFPPARIFMGDVGSSILGLLAAAFSLWGTRDGIFPFWAALLVFSPFIVDATVTLLRRLIQGEKFWQAHKTHYYQKLVLAGWGHRKTVLLEYIIMIVCGITALWGIRFPDKLQSVLVGGWVLFYFFFFLWVSRLAARHYKTGTL